MPASAAGSAPEPRRMTRLETPRLVIRTFAPGDAEAWLALVNDPRQLSDDQIKRLIQRGAVIGMALDTWMMIPNWERGKTLPEEAGVTLETIVRHVDHVCQLAGNARHVAIGTDLDGGFGREQSPMDLDTIADLQRLPELLQRHGYPAIDIEGIMYGNWVRFFGEAWSKK